MEVDGLDTIRWGGTSTRQFSVKSAYDLFVSNRVIAEGIDKYYGNEGDHIVFKFSCG